MSSDGGSLLLSAADRNLRLSSRMADAIVDHRQPGKVKFPVKNLLASRLLFIAAGYVDANDFDSLNRDPGFLLGCGKLPADTLASQPTMSRLENMVSSKDLVCLSETLAWITVEQLPSNTHTVVLDIDATDDPCHGQQQFEFFNGFYDKHCYLPLYLHVTGNDGVQRLMGSLLRPGNAGPRTGLFILLEKAVELLRERFPKLRISLRGDGAFGDNKILDFCEDYSIGYTIGMRSNNVLKRKTKELADEVCASYAETGMDCQNFIAFNYRAKSWNSVRRIVAKVETVQGKLNIRYVVTSRTNQKAERVYKFYCERGEQENRIKEMKNDLQSGRTSCHSFKANQFRLLLHTAACILWRKVQDTLKNTIWANKQIGSLRLMLIKVAARVHSTTRRLVVQLPSLYPYQNLWHIVHRGLSPPCQP